MGSLEDFANAKLGILTAQDLYRQLAESDRGNAAMLTRGGRQMISFSCNDYLNLSAHPKIIEAAVAATRRYGAGAGASRAVTGNHPLYAALERRLATLKGTAAAVVFGSGYLANSGVIPALLGPEDVIFIDQLAHACIWAGAKLAGARVVRFAHNNMEDLAARLLAARASHHHAMIATETVFSMDGDCAPIGEIVDLANKFDAWSLTDDAHGLGVVPAAPAAKNISLQMGTLSKAVGGYGGYVCTSAAVAALIRNRARSFIYTTGLPPGVVGAAIAALDLIAGQPAHAALPLRKAQRFTRAIGLADATSPIVPVILGNAKAALAASADLGAAGFLVAAIRPPTVPEGTSRLRFAFTAAHADADIDRLAALVHALLLIAA